eukprot:4500358-Amphidinium_carterae.1
MVGVVSQVAIAPWPVRAVAPDPFLANDKSAHDFDDVDAESWDLHLARVVPIDPLPAMEASQKSCDFMMSAFVCPIEDFTCEEADGSLSPCAPRERKIFQLTRREDVRFDIAIASDGYDAIVSELLCSHSVPATRSRTNVFGEVESHAAVWVVYQESGWHFQGWQSILPLT